MASRLEEDLCCPICHDVFRDPVVLSCSHSFCKDCLKSWWTEKQTRECPVCKRRSSKERLPCNLVLKNLCEAFLQERDPRASEALCRTHSGECPRLETSNQAGYRVLRKSVQRKGLKLSGLWTIGELQETLEPLKEKLKVCEQVKEEFDQTVEHINAKARHTERFELKFVGLTAGGSLSSGMDRGSGRKD
ncbi:tripartite motif-containing 13-like [Morone saxatilis]|uniref:tripartite motif-containing 13-like n=1 Tax=Morone saxatilis TaxID=34816 RepID=UPI0015E251D6|nr:tripartite motif-containing 13-like [Morone saxatilis]